MTKQVTIDGNEAAAYIAHKTNEVIAIYPITPSSNMGELADDWSAQDKTNIWGAIPKVIEMQSEAGAAGTLHGALQAGSLTTTFTASQGLLLMIPNMYKISGELSPTVFHIAARSLAAQALSIFGDHSDVMACRGTGFAMLGSASVQEVMDMALIAQSASLKSRIPFLHFFDGFRTSHELNKIELISDSVIKEMIDDELVFQHRKRALSPDHPLIRGTSQNPDVYFQTRETVNPYYKALPKIVQQTMDQFAQLTGRQYKLFDYFGSKKATELVILIGSSCQTVTETIEQMLKSGKQVGMLQVRLFRPLNGKALIKAIPKTVKRIAVLDRLKEPGASGEPLYKDVITAFAEHISQGSARFKQMPKIFGGRYGLSSKEFTPGMVQAVFDNLIASKPKTRFTIGIHDDVSNLSLNWQEIEQNPALENVKQCVFYGLGADGTVSANKNSIKIISEETEQFTQGYFVYDSKKSGAITISHLRFSKHPILSSYLIGDNQAQFVGCHQTVFLERLPILDKAAKKSVFLLNTPAPKEQVWQSLPGSIQKQIIEKEISFFIIDAYEVAHKTGMGRRINTIMQTCFFAISGILPQDEAIDKIKLHVEKSYGRKGRNIVQLNFAAIDSTIEALHKVKYPQTYKDEIEVGFNIPKEAPEFVHKVTAELMAEHGNDLPVSAFTDDGSWPLGTAAYEKRNIALEIPVWDADLCIYCGKCPFVCPHSAIRSKVFTEDEVKDAPQSFKHVAIKGREFPNLHVSYQIAPEDCTGCKLCVEICPARDKSNASYKALNMQPQPPLRQQEHDNWEYFLKINEYDRKKIQWNKMKAAMMAQPLFEFSGACSGCGETPYVRLATQLFGDRMIIGNATGCSSIYGGNLPTTPYTTNPENRGPAWSNSLFEDTAEFGLGFRLSIDQHARHAKQLLNSLDVDQQLSKDILNASQSTEAEIFEQRDRIEILKSIIKDNPKDQAKQLLSVVDYLAKKSVWAFGGDGWAYDIGFGGLDHVLASGHNINILVMDTEVYSNTGGQTSKATPKGAIAKFSSAGKPTRKKDLGMIAMAYENVYVAQVAFGAKDIHTLKTFLEAESWDGPSIIIAYSPCIAHGIDMVNNLDQQKLAVNSGYWPLYRYNPALAQQGKNPLHLDSPKPKVALAEYYRSETRFNMLNYSHPQTAARILEEEQRAILDHYHHLEQLANLPVDDLSQQLEKLKKE